MYDRSMEESSSKTIRENIVRQMFNYALSYGGFLLSDLAKLTGYSVTTINKYISSMQENGHVTVLGKVQKHSKGRQAIRYGVNPEFGYFLGVDIKTFELSLGLINMCGNMIAVKTDNTFKFSNTHECLEYVCQVVDGFIEAQTEIDSSKILGICFNLSGRVNAMAGTSASIFNFEEMQGISLSDLLTERFGRKVYLENDSKSMAFGEYVSGINQKYQNVLYVNLGWGLGVGIIIYGKIYYGMDGYSGELGHIPVYNNNIICHCGKKGCLETEVSGRALHRKIMERLRAGEESLMSRILEEKRELTMEDILQAVEKEDPLAWEEMDKVACELGKAMAMLINVFNPEAIVIGGIFSEVDPAFIKAIELSTRKHSLKLVSQKVAFLGSSLKQSAGVVGACMIARARTFDNL